jgi:hypothetical protein
VKERPTQEVRTHRERLLGGALCDILVAMSVLRPDVEPTGPELLVMAQDAVRLLNEQAVERAETAEELDKIRRWMELDLNPSTRNTAAHWRFFQHSAIEGYLRLLFARYLPKP